MKIRYLLLHAYGKGGTIRTVLNQATSMAEAGHEVEVISVFRRRDRVMFPLDDRVRITTLVDLRQASDEAPRKAGPLNRLQTLRKARLSGRKPRHIPKGEFSFQSFDRHVEREIIRYLRGVTDGVLVSTRPALNILVARYVPTNVPRIAQDHMNLSVYRKDVRTAIARNYGRFDAIAVLTRGELESYRRLLPESRIVHIPNAVHATKPRYTTYSNHLAVAAGRLMPQKGFDLLIPAFGRVVGQHSDWQLRIFGTGTKMAELRGLIERHHLYNNVFLMGHSRQLDEELAKASFYVLSSRFEGLPMVLIEAMTHGLPAVSFDCPTGPADVITHGKEGLLVPAGDVDALAEGMRQLMDDEGLRAEMGAAALATARLYAPEVVHPRWEALFNELLPPTKMTATSGYPGPTGGAKAKAAREARP